MRGIGRWKIGYRFLGEQKRKDLPSEIGVVKRRLAVCERDAKVSITTDGTRPTTDCDDNLNKKKTGKKDEDEKKKKRRQRKGQK